MTAKGWGGAVIPVREGVLTAVESVLTLDADSGARSVEATLQNT
jgi:hypothetical protein